MTQFPIDEAPALLSNRTFEELSLGDSAQFSHVLSRSDIELFAAVSGDINPAHLDPVFAEKGQFHSIIGHGMWGGALISAVLGTRLPGPGTIYLGQDLRFRRPVRPGDAITAVVTVRELRAEKRIVLLDCRCINQFGEDVITGTAEVLAPREKVSWPVGELPSVNLHHHGRDPLDLSGKRGLIVGIANDQSIAYGCARALQSAGAELAITYLNAKAEPHVRPLAEGLEAALIVPCDVREPGELEAVFVAIQEKWGRLDFLLHSIAFAPREDLHGALSMRLRQGFRKPWMYRCIPSCAWQNSPSR
jgi:acyl dehydratase